MSNLPGWKELKPFVFWCSKVLPTVFDESMTYYEALCQVHEILNNVITDVNLLNQAYKDFVDTANTNYEQFVQQITAKVQELETYMNSYFDNLDVQKEINNKLDEMLNNGTLTNIILSITSSYYYPVIVDSISEMTDTKKLYILSTSGDLYSYKNGSWVNSGISYGSLSNNLTVNNSLIIAGNYKSLLPDLNNVIQNKVYVLSFANGTTSNNLPLNLPNKEIPWRNSIGVLQVFNPVSTGVGCTQIYISGKCIYRRHQYQPSSNQLVWASWIEVTNQNLMEYINPIVGSTNYLTRLPDCNNVWDSSIFVLNFATGTTKQNLPNNLPGKETPWPSSYPGVLETINWNNNVVENLATVQIYYGYNGIYKRFYTMKNNVNQWTDWYELTDKNIKEHVMPTVNTASYNSLLPDLNEAFTSALFILNFPTSTTANNLPLNVPKEEIPWSALPAVLEVINTSNIVESVGTTQIFYGKYGVYKRYFSQLNDDTFWTDWYSITGKNIINVYSTDNIVEVISSAPDNSHIIIHPGEYDIIANYKELYGNDYFNNYTESYHPMGLKIGKDMIIEGIPGHILKADMDSSNQYAQNWFSLLNAGNGNFHLKNLKLYVHNCRYCVHDEYNANTIEYEHIYENCVMENLDQGAGYIQCIGGGMGSNGTIKIHDCEFTSTTANDNDGVVSWHQGQTACVGKIVLKDCVFKNGTFRLSWYGNGNSYVDGYVSNNLVKAKPFTRAENESATIVNVRLFEWNNQINN